MKRYTFRLTRLRRLREVEEQQALLAVRDARAAEDVATAALAAARADYAAVPSPPAAQSGGAWARERWVAEQRALAVRAAEQQVTTVAASARAAGTEWRSRSQRLEALVRLDARLRAEHVHAQLERQARLDDDLATVRWRQRHER